MSNNKYNRTVSNRVRRNGPVLLALEKASEKVRKAAMATATKDLVQTLVEFAVNIIKENLPVTPNQLSRLRRYRKELEELIRGTTPLKRKKEILQTGGFLPLLIGPAVSLLSGLLGGVLKKGR